MMNQVDVEGVKLSGRDNSVHDLVRACICAFLGNQANAPEDTEDVRVKGEDFLKASEKKRAGDGLRPDAAKLQEIASGIFARKMVKETEVERAMLCFNLPKHVLDNGGLLVCQPARSNSFGNSICACAKQSVPRRETLFQRGEGAVRIRIARGLRENNVHQHVERVGRAPIFGHTVSPLKILDDVTNRLLV